MSDAHAPAPSEALTVGLSPLTIEDVISVARDHRRVRSLPTQLETAGEMAPVVSRMLASAAWVSEAVARIASGD